MRRTLSELQRGDPLVLVLSRRVSVQSTETARRPPATPREMQVGHCRRVTISTDNLIDTKEFALQSGPSGRFSRSRPQTADALDIPESTDPDHNSMIPHRLVLEPGLRGYQIYSGYSGNALEQVRGSNASRSLTTAALYAVAQATGSYKRWPTAELTFIVESAYDQYQSLMDIGCRQAHSLPATHVKGESQRVRPVRNTAGVAYRVGHTRALDERTEQQEV